MTLSKLFCFLLSLIPWIFPLKCIILCIITLATSCEELTHWKRLWCWEVMGAGGEGDDRGWDGWMASLTRWTWVSVNSGSWWWTGRSGVLRFMGLQRVGHDWATDLIWLLQLCFPFFWHYVEWTFLHILSNYNTCYCLYFTNEEFETRKHIFQSTYLISGAVMI